MITRVLYIDPSDFKESELVPAADVIKSGGLVIFPTETVYGIGADATRPECAAKIYSAKGRPSDNPLIVRLADPSDAEQYAYTSPLFYRLAGAFMPGPLTVIMPKKDSIPTTVTGGLDSVAVRVPSHPVANALIRLSGLPIAAPSANISGRPSATNAGYALRDFNGRADVIVDGGESDCGLESTIVRITGRDSLLLLRPGAVTPDEIMKKAGCVLEISDAVTGKLAEGERPLSPGMKYRHYSPSKPLTLVSGSREARIRFFRKAQETENAAVICYDEQLPHLRRENAIPAGGETDLETQAHRLFYALRAADSLPCDSIYANLPPASGLGLALYNRLIRAAAYRIVDADSAPDKNTRK